MSGKLPLPEDTERPRIDVVVLVLDMRSLASMHALTANLDQLDADFCLGRAALCLLHGLSPPPNTGACLWLDEARL
jgi:hypothetical protein